MVFPTGISPSAHFLSASSLYSNANEVDMKSISEEQFREVLDLILSKFEAHSKAKPDETFIVGLAGTAGAGKTTFVDQLIHRLNDAGERNGTPMGAVAVPMDGYHLWRSELKAMPNSEEAFARRGAPWTFNPQALAKDLAQLKATGFVKFPGFDHAAKDPEPEKYVVTKANRLVLMEGLYMLYTDGPWAQVSAQLDCRLFLFCDLDIATERLVKRHMKVWGISQEEARVRATGNDYVNGQLVQETRGNADLILQSVCISE
jgi:pantothenate kinase